MDLHAYPFLSIFELELQHIQYDVISYTVRCVIMVPSLMCITLSRPVVVHFAESISSLCMWGRFLR